MTANKEPNPKIKNVAGVCSTNDINRNSIQIHSITKGWEWRKPSRLRVALDYVLSPLWVSIPRHKGRLVFHLLSYLIGGGRLYLYFAASYLRFLATKEGRA